MFFVKITKNFLLLEWRVGILLWAKKKIKIKEKLLLYPVFVDKTVIFLRLKTLYLLIYFVFKNFFFQKLIAVENMFLVLSMRLNLEVSFE